MVYPLAYQAAKLVPVCSALLLSPLILFNYLARWLRRRISVRGLVKLKQVCEKTLFQLL